MTCESEGQHSSAQLMSEEDTKDEDDQTSGDRGNVANLMEEAPSRNRRCPHAIFVIMRLGGV